MMNIFFSSHKQLICCNGNESKEAVIIINKSIESNDGSTNQAFEDNHEIDRFHL